MPTELPNILDLILTEEETDKIRPMIAVRSDPTPHQMLATIDYLRAELRLTHVKLDHWCADVCALGDKLKRTR